MGMSDNEKRQQLIVSVSDDVVAALRALGREHGMTTTTGRMAGTGNVSALLTAVGKGELVVVRRVDYDQLSALAYEVGELKERLDAIEAKTTKAAEDMV